MNSGRAARGGAVGAVRTTRAGSRGRHRGDTTRPRGARALDRRSDGGRRCLEEEPRDRCAARLISKATGSSAAVPRSGGSSPADATALRRNAFATQWVPRAAPPARTHARRRFVRRGERNHVARGGRSTQSIGSAGARSRRPWRRGRRANEAVLHRRRSTRHSAGSVGVRCESSTMAAARVREAPQAAARRSEAAPVSIASASSRPRGRPTSSWPGALVTRGPRCGSDRLRQQRSDPGAGGASGGPGARRGKNRPRGQKNLTAITGCGEPQLRRPGKTNPDQHETRCLPCGSRAEG
jgi:hypothetical protein